MTPPRPTRRTILALAAAALCPVAAWGGAERVLVFAAASLGGALGEIAAAREDGAPRLVVSAAASSLLARQIQAGAPADLFVSANPDWMDTLSADGLIAEDSRRDLLTNRLVLIAPASRADGAPIRLDTDIDIATRLGGGRLAVALTDAVPAGIYAKAALRSLGLWESTRHRLAEADNVRTALAFVATGASPLGIVYATDAIAEPRVRVLAEIPADAHPPIRYPAAILRGRERPQTRALLAELEGPAAGAIFARHGFGRIG